MEWHELFPKSRQPELSDIGDYIASPLWPELLDGLTDAYGVAPLAQYSVCSGAPGWNVKFRKGGRALCTLYPREGFFTCLVCVGAREAPRAELALHSCGSCVRDLYFPVKPFNGARWPMIDVTSPGILEDVKRLIAARALPTGKKAAADRGKKGEKV